VSGLCVVVAIHFCGRERQDLRSGIDRSKFPDFSIPQSRRPWDSAECGDHSEFNPKEDYTAKLSSIACCANVPMQILPFTSARHRCDDNLSENH
jgi:hypothetical protein